MKLFLIGLKRNLGYQIKAYPIDEDNRTKLTIKNLLEDDQDYEDIDFVLPISTEQITDKDKVEIDFSKLKKIKRQYIFEQKTDKDNQNITYALLHNSNNVPSDIYIPVSMKEKVQVLKEIRFHDIEVDYGCFIAPTYFVKIKLSRWDTIPFYFTFKDAKLLDRHVVFIRTDSNISVKKCNTFMYLDNRKGEYISLSEL